MRTINPLGWTWMHNLFPPECTGAAGPRCSGSFNVDTKGNANANGNACAYSYSHSRIVNIVKPIVCFDCPFLF